MKQLNNIEFQKLLASEDSEKHQDYEIVIEEPLQIDISKITTENKFHNCFFKGARIDFVNNLVGCSDEPSHILNFDNCEILNVMIFKECSFLELSFTYLNRNIESLHIAAKSITNLIFEGNRFRNDYRLNVSINQTNILNELRFEDINSSGKLLIHNSNIRKSNLRSLNFKEVEITKNKFESDFRFIGNLISKTLIKENSFENSDFTRTNFGNSATLKKNVFNGIAEFTSLTNRESTQLVLENCIFKDYSDFNKSELFKLTIDNCKFLEVSSIQEVELELMVLDRTIFENFVFFDDLSILNINQCNQRTIRNIKLELLH